MTASFSIWCSRTRSPAALNTSQRLRVRSVQYSGWLLAASTRNRQPLGERPGREARVHKRAYPSVGLRWSQRPTKPRSSNDQTLVKAHWKSLTSKGVRKPTVPIAKHITWPVFEVRGVGAGVVGPSGAVKGRWSWSSICLGPGCGQRAAWHRQNVSCCKGVLHSSHPPRP
jgi:hypothetical protein